MRLLDHVLDTSASLSECGTYRYDLTRTWDHGLQKVMWVMLNPSTASVDVDDPTVRRTQTFAQVWGYGGVVVCNLFALRSTDPKVLYRHPDPVGRGNDDVLLEWADSAQVGLVVAAWGAHGSLWHRGRRVAELLATTAVDVRCLGTTKTGHPRHPLYIKGTTQLQPMVCP